jgi:hypothetical protein
LSGIDCCWQLILLSIQGRPKAGATANRQSHPNSNSLTFVSLHLVTVTQQLPMLAADGRCQVILLIAACVAGVFFGLYYHFLILAPVTLVAGLTCSLTALLLGQDAQSTLLAVALPAVGLQAGYLLGLASRDGVANLPKRDDRAQSTRVWP